MLRENVWMLRENVWMLRENVWMLRENVSSISYGSMTRTSFKCSTLYVICDLLNDAISISD